MKTATGPSKQIQIQPWQDSPPIDDPAEELSMSNANQQSNQKGEQKREPKRGPVEHPNPHQGRGRRERQTRKGSGGSLT